jgi:hypothetical protein
VNDFERDVRAAVYTSFVDDGVPPSIDALSLAFGCSRDGIASALQALAHEHCLVLMPDGESIWMAHPFSGIESDFIVGVGGRRWFANCVWDGLTILALFGDGVLETHSPESGEPLRFDVTDSVVSGEGLVHFLVPVRRFWDDIGFT